MFLEQEIKVATHSINVVPERKEKNSRFSKSLAPEIAVQKLITLFEIHPEELNT